jgi:hypothetical protein
MGGAEMKVRAHISGKYVLEHDQYSPALLETGRVIPGCFRDGGRNAIAGSADAIEAAVKYLIEVRGLRADAFEDTEAVEWAAPMACAICT